ncbi:hypothetical protein BC831DRAFT_296160 [Entophlyctis helioformis]|nr:hypothetical protein BC831DRAFT_296160 [Entophlyctis helioformis]
MLLICHSIRQPQGDPNSVVWENMDKWDRDLRREHALFSKSRSEQVYIGEIDADTREDTLVWMHKVSCERGLLCKTFHMAVCYVDAYVAHLPQQVTRGNVKLLAMFCLYEAVKLEHVDKSAELFYLLQFALEDLQSVAARKRKLDELSKQYRRFEANLLILFGYDLLIPSAFDHLLGCFERCRMLIALKRGVRLPDFDVIGDDNDIYDLLSNANSLLDRAVCDVESLKFSNSQLASSAFYRAVMTHESLAEEPFHPVDVQLVTGFTLAELGECLEFMSRFNILRSTVLSCAH